MRYAIRRRRNCWLSVRSADKPRSMPRSGRPGRHSRAGARRRWRIGSNLCSASSSFSRSTPKKIAAIVTRENGKTLAESRGSVRRGIQMVEVATGAPSLLMGQCLEDVAGGIDCDSVRQPIGVFACIAPFNFPAMVPMWFYPFAVACGNTYVCKPSEQVPLSQAFLWELIDKAEFPPGVLNLVHGGRDCANAILEHPDIEGISFVGSSPVAEHVYKTAAAHGKRVQALGGAKNFIFIMPDADMEAALDAVAASAYGCAGRTLSRRQHRGSGRRLPPTSPRWFAKTESLRSRLAMAPNPALRWGR